MLTPTQKNKLNLVRNAHNIDNQRREKVALQKKSKLLGFKAYLKEKYSGGLNETLAETDVQDAMLATLPINATQSDLDDVASAISILNQSGAVVVTAIAVMEN